MIFLLLTPAAIQTLHAFEKHEKIICHSDVDQHFHEDNLECILCHLQTEIQGALFHNHYEVELNFEQSEYFKQYNFLKNHQHLSFSLRGPPIFN